MKIRILVIGKIARVLFIATLAGCFPGGALSQAAANFRDSSSSAALSYSPNASSAVNFSASAAYNGGSASSGGGTGPRSSGVKQQRAPSSGYSPSAASALERKLAENHGIQPSAAQIQAASSLPATTNPFAAGNVGAYRAIQPTSLGASSLTKFPTISSPFVAGKVGVRRAIQPTGLGASSLTKSRASALPSPPSQSSTSTSNPDMSILKRLRGISRLSGSPRSLRSQKSTSRLTTRNQELKSLMGISGQR